MSTEQVPADGPMRPEGRPSAHRSSQGEARQVPAGGQREGSIAKKKSFQGFVRSVRNKAFSHLFLIAAAIAAGIAVPLYFTSTKTPEVELSGFAMVYVDNPAVSAKVTILYGTYYKRTKNGSDIGGPTLGSDNITALTISISLSGGSSNSTHHYLLVLGGDARLTRTDLSLGDGLTVHSANGTWIKYRGMSARADIQEFEGTIFGSSEPQLAGYLTAKVVDTGSGKTFARIPSMGTPVESAVETGDVNETMKPQEVLVAGKRWYLPKTAKYNAKLGTLTAGIDVDEARPQIDSGDPTVLRWSGSNVEQPQALLSNNISIGRATKQLFFAGVLAGLAGGFLVEGLSRLRLGEGQTNETSSPGPQKPPPRDA